MQNRLMPLIWVGLAVSALFIDNSVFKAALLVIAGIGAVASVWAKTSGGTRWWTLSCLALAFALAVTPLQRMTGNWTPWACGTFLLMALAPSVLSMIKEAVTSVSAAKRTVAELKAGHTGRHT